MGGGRTIVNGKAGSATMDMPIHGRYGEPLRRIAWGARLRCRGTDLSLAPGAWAVFGKDENMDKSPETHRELWDRQRREIEAVVGRVEDELMGSKMSVEPRMPPPEPPPPPPLSIWQKYGEDIVNELVDDLQRPARRIAGDDGMRVPPMFGCSVRPDPINWSRYFGWLAPLWRECRDWCVGPVAVACVLGAVLWIVENL